jgi:hypothetical protein
VPRKGNGLDQIEVWPDPRTAQAAIDAFRDEYNADRPHQSPDMAFPADRFAARRTDERLLPLPPALAAASAEPRPALAGQRHDDAHLAGALDQRGRPVDLAVGSARVVPLSGNLTVCGQQFWLGPDLAGATVTFWADTTVAHLLTNGVRLKTVLPG